MKKCGIIDIGSNSIRMGLYEYDDYSFRLIDSYVQVKELVSFVKDGKLTDKGISACVSTIVSFKDFAHTQGITSLYAIATAFARKLDNPDSFIKEVEKYVKIEILTSEQEAKLSFKGSMANVDMLEGVMIDIGGGSTELVQFTNNKITYETSYDTGCVALHDLNPVEPELYIEDILRKEKHHFSGDMLGTGGTVESLFIIYDKLNDKRIKLSKYEVAYILKHYDDENIKAIIEEFIYARKETLRYGLTILSTIMNYYQIDELYLSEYGLKEGYLIENIMNK